MKKFIKNLPLQNCWADFEDFEIISQIPRVILFKNCALNCCLSIHMALVKGGYFHYKDLDKFFNLFIWNCQSDFENNFIEIVLRWPFSKMFAKFWSVTENGSGEWGLLALNGHEEILKKKTSPRGPMVRFRNIFTEMLLRWLFSETVCKTLWWMGATGMIWTWTNFTNSSFLKQILK